MAPERRTALIGWAHEADVLIIEDDHDGEHRCDREPVGALQGLAPERVLLAASGATARSIRARLDDSAKDLMAPGRDLATGFGMVDAASALGPADR